MDKKTVGDEFIYICLVELIADTNYAFMEWKACDSFTTFTWWYGYISIQGSFSSVGWARKPVSSITLQKLTATCKWTQLELTLTTLSIEESSQHFPKSFLKINIKKLAEKTWISFTPALDRAGGWEMSMFVIFNESRY